MRLNVDTLSTVFVMSIILFSITKILNFYEFGPETYMSYVYFYMLLLVVYVVHENN